MPVSYLLSADTNDAATLPARDALLGLASASRIRERSREWPALHEIWQEASASDARRVVVDLVLADPLAAHHEVLLRQRPASLLSGLRAAIHATQADEAVFALPSTRQELPSALRRHLDAGALGGTPWRVVAVPKAAVSGLEEALAAAALGRPALPTELPVRPSALGIAVHRVETLLQLDRLLLVGPERFRREETVLVGTHAGSNLAGTAEVRLGTDIGRAIGAAGAPAPAAPCRMVMGDSLSAPLPYDPLLPLDPEALQRRGGMLGAGGIRLLVRPDGGGESHVRHLAQGSCGQCPSCRMAALRITHALSAKDLPEAHRTARFARGKGLCPLLDALCDSTLSLPAGNGR